jgi:hypothetical protein
MTLKYNFKNVFRVQFSKLSNCTDFVYMSVSNNTRIASFDKIGSDIQALIGGDKHRQHDDLISLNFSFRKESGLKTKAGCTKQIEVTGVENLWL